MRPLAAIGPVPRAGVARLLLVGVIALGAGCAGATDPESSGTSITNGSESEPEGTDAGAVPPAGRTVAVERVVDGDTIVVSGGERVRLIGIDTPESVKPDSPVECYGKEASRRLAALLPVGTTVVLVRDAEATDRYDRTLAYVYRADDGAFVNAQLVAEGFAYAYTVPPNVTHADELAARQADAREAGRGLWSACPPRD